VFPTDPLRIRSWLSYSGIGPSRSYRPALSKPDDDRSFLARLSLPSRLIFMMATAHLPVIVLGHPIPPSRNS